MANHHGHQKIGRSIFIFSLMLLLSVIFLSNHFNSVVHLYQEEYVLKMKLSQLNFQITQMEKQAQYLFEKRKQYKQVMKEYAILKQKQLMKILPIIAQRHDILHWAIQMREKQEGNYSKSSIIFSAQGSKASLLSFLRELSQSIANIDLYQIIWIHRGDKEGELTVSSSFLNAR